MRISDLVASNEEKDTITKQFYPMVASTSKQSYFQRGAQHVSHEHGDFFVTTFFM